MKKMYVLMAMIVFCSCAGNKQAVVGGDKDAHGCLPSAGYSWCEDRQKCIRTWEEPCVKGEIITACYACEGLGEIVVDYYKEDGASILAAGNRYKLERAISASGARYTGRDIMIWDKGGNARFELAGKEYQCAVRDCKK